MTLANAHTPAREADVAAALPGRHDVADDGKRHRHDTTGPHALNAPEQDELDHPLRQPSEQRAHQEDQDGGLKDHPPAIEVLILP